MKGKDKILLVSIVFSVIFIMIYKNVTLNHYSVYTICKIEKKYRVKRTRMVTISYKLNTKSYIENHPISENENFILGKKYLLKVFKNSISTSCDVILECPIEDSTIIAPVGGWKSRPFCN